MTDPSGNTEWTYTYEPFGTPRTTVQVDPNAPVNPLGYTGQYQDPATSLLDLRARQYNPTLGAFTSTDPVLNGKTSPYESAYTYAGDDPINHDDLNGQSCKWAGYFGKWAKKVCHKIASPAVTARDELKAQAQAANATAVSESTGGGTVQAEGPISGPANSPAPITNQFGVCTANGKLKLGGAAILLGVGGVLLIGGTAAEAAAGPAALSSIVRGGAVVSAIARPSTISATGGILAATGVALCKPQR